MSLTKSYALQTDGSILKSSYPHAYEFTSHEETCPDLPSMLRAIDKHALLGHCMLKGELRTPLISQSRAGSTATQDATDWLCLDIDGLPDTYLPDTTSTRCPYTPNQLMADIGLGEVSYILQWSASYGISDTSLRCHIFVQIDRKIPAPVLKQWLIHLNHSVTHLRNSQALTKTGNSLTWALDVTACQNDKLLYIAPPVLKKIKNPLGKTPRTSLVRKPQQTFVFPQNFNASKNRDLTDKRIMELRAASGLPKRKMTYKVVGGNEVLVKPDSCDATEIRHERGFTYFNINGGDSWGYWHPENCPDYIYNFKGEPVYQTKDLLPDYWKSLQDAGQRQSSDGLTYLAFSDRQTGTYWKGTYDPKTDELDIVPAKTLIILDHFAKQHGMILGDFVPEWTITFDPQSAITVDTANKVVNTFQLSEYMKAEPKEVKTCPPTILRFIHHALGSDSDITEHFLNWLAYIVQFRDRTLTSWVLHGTQGCLSGDTRLEFNRGARPSGRSLTVKQAYEKWTGQFKQGTGLGKSWDMSLTTRTKSVKDGMTIGFHEVFSIVESGVKPLFKLTTNWGRTIRVTELHPFMRPDGSFTPLNELNVGDEVVVEGSAKNHVPAPKGRKPRHTTHSVPYHPHGWRQVIGGRDYKRVHTARLVVEADMNDMELSELVAILRTDPSRAATLRFLPPSQIVHHMDENPMNDALENLVVIDKLNHDKHHAKEIGLGTISTRIEIIKSIKTDKTEMTYDVVMKAPYHNYVANGFVVHNTGKGVLVNNIVRPLFGRKQTASIRMRDLGQQYNGYMRQSFVVYVDEMQASAMMDEEGVMADLRNFVTEPEVTIRDMYSAPVEVRNYTNWIVSSNKPDPLSIPKNDRRTNVAKYQPIKFYPTSKDLEQWPKHEALIKKELQAFHDYLFHFAVDKTTAATPIDTVDRHTMISIGENAIDTVSTALLEGNMGWLIEQLPTSNAYKSDPLALNRVENYRTVLKDILHRADPNSGKACVARDELRTIYEYTVGKIPESPNKFTSLLKHHRIHTKKIWLNSEPVMGITTEFKDIAQFGAYLKSHFPQTRSKA